MVNIPGAHILNRVWKRHDNHQREALRYEATLVIAAMAGQLRQPASHRLGLLSQTFLYPGGSNRQREYDELLTGAIRRAFEGAGYVVEIESDAMQFIVTLDWRQAPLRGE